jgi:SAM-dependent methyltransferase
MPTYRWNTSDFAIGYDAAAQIIHPHYTAIQDGILDLLSAVPCLLSPVPSLIIDLGGGSGRLLERILDQFPCAHGLIIDQSEPFLALAERRLARFGPRATCILSRLQDNWPEQIPLASSTPQSTIRNPQSEFPTPRIAAFVSMSAIHHLDPAEKQSLYRRCHDLLSPGGILINGDEVRPEDDRDYLATLNAWADHMRREMVSGAIPPAFHSARLGWIDRNITHFGQPKKSGDDCHETIAAQLAYFRSAGFTSTDSPWQKDLWAILRGVK